MNVQLDDRLYKEAERRAAEAGFTSVDAYVADVVRFDLSDAGPGESPTLDHLFTPERLAKIDAAIAEVDAGKTHTAEEVREYFKQKRAAWHQKSSPR